MRKKIVVKFRIGTNRGVDVHSKSDLAFRESLKNKLGTLIKQMTLKRPNIINDNFFLSLNMKASLLLNATHKYLSIVRHTYNHDAMCVHTRIKNEMVAQAKSDFNSTS